MTQTNTNAQDRDSHRLPDARDAIPAIRDHEGKRVLVTGGAGVIGAITAGHYLRRGARVVLADIDDAGLERAAKELSSMGDVVTHRGDLADEDDVGALFDHSREAFGGLDIVFNNAGIAGTVAPVHELAVEDWDRTIRTNLRSMFLVLKHAAACMVERRAGGAIVNMGSSMSGWDVLAGGSGYAASKHAVVGLTRSAALDLGAHAIRVNAICPGVIETSLGVPGIDDGTTDSKISAVAHFAERIPLRRIGQADDVAEIVLFLGSDAARHVTGAAWLVDGGQTLQSFSNAPRDGAYRAR